MADAEGTDVGGAGAVVSEADAKRPRVAVVGGGILGMTAAYRLAQAGVEVAVYERAPDLGGLVGSFDFDGTRVGFYDDGRLFSMTSPKELLTFPLLRLHERIRLGLFVARCQLTRSHERLDETPLLGWLQRLCGRRVTERLWEPLLDSKFDGR